MIESMTFCEFYTLADEGIGFLRWLMSDGRVELIATVGREGDRKLAELSRFGQTVKGLMEKLALPEEGEIDGVLADRLKSNFWEVLPALKEGLVGLVTQASRQEADKNRARELLDQVKLLRRFPGRPKLEPQKGEHSSLWWLPLRQGVAIATRLEKSLAERGGVLRWAHRESPRRDSDLLEFSLSVTWWHWLVENLEDAGGTMWRAKGELGQDDYRALIDSLEEKEMEYNKRVEMREAQKTRMATNWGKRFRTLLRIANQETRLQHALLSGEEVGKAMVFSGWLPTSAVEDFQNKLDTQFKGRVLLQMRQPKESDNPPTLLRHNWYTRPFRHFLKLVRPPRYGAVDPTAAIALFFPFFAGCIVGDAGYGILLLLMLFFLCRRAHGVVQDVSRILASVALWSVFWGLLFGEFFGDLGHRIFSLHPLWVERHHAVIPVLALAVGFGFLHVLLGLAFGAWLGVKEHHTKHAIEKCGNIFVIAGVAGAVLAAAGIIPAPFLWPSVCCSALGMVGMAFGGIGGLIESLGSLGNVLSYVRIGAIGLSSAILALTAGEFLNTFGVGFTGLFSFLAIHALNFVLAFAESSLHSARLHLVEYMGKFYDDRGHYYRPFTGEEDLNG